MKAHEAVLALGHEEGDAGQPAEHVRKRSGEVFVEPD
jgi:hypothetical protein